MEREAEQGGGDSNQQPQPPPPPPPQQQQQQCPRCESLNTKFCYYNNYSLSQPRFFCKACKRYWTQGGILRNIPIGGASRKRKRSTVSSSSSTTIPQLQQPQQQQVTTHEVVQLQNQPNMTTLMRPTPPTPRVVQSTNPYYQGGGVGGGYLSSLAVVHSLNPPSPLPLNPSLNVGVGDVVASTNLCFLSGLNEHVSLGLQHQYPNQIHAPRFYQIGNNRIVEPLLRQEHGFNVPPNMVINATAHGIDHWPQRFINNAANHTAPDTSLWSTVSTTVSTSSGTRNSTRGGGSSSLMPNRWSNFPGNGSPYQ